MAGGIDDAGIVAKFKQSLKKSAAETKEQTKKLTETELVNLKLARSNQILADVRTRIANRIYPIEITPEMKELNIEGEVQAILNRAETVERMRKLYGMDDDSDSVESYDEELYPSPTDLL